MNKRFSGNNPVLFSSGFKGFHIYYFSRISIYNKTGEHIMKAGEVGTTYLDQRPSSTTRSGSHQHNIDSSDITQAIRKQTSLVSKLLRLIGYLPAATHHCGPNYMSDSGVVISC